MALMFIWRSYKSGHADAKPTATSSIIIQRLEIILHVADVELTVVWFYVTYQSFRMTLYIFGEQGAENI
jgi:hypothetical protein